MSSNTFDLEPETRNQMMRRRTKNNCEKRKNGETLELRSMSEQSRNEKGKFLEKRCKHNRTLVLFCIIILLLQIGVVKVSSLKLVNVKTFVCNEGWK